MIGIDQNLNMSITNNINNNSSILENDINIYASGDVNITGLNFKVNQGNVYARKVVVTASAFPDYVFKEGYKLKSLAETEAYIKANGHLEDVPTEIEAKEKGINVAEMNSVLLKKIEEMTLLMIEQNKRIEELKVKVESLENK